MARAKQHRVTIGSGGSGNAPDGTWKSGVFKSSMTTTEFDDFGTWRGEPTTCWGAFNPSYSWIGIYKWGEGSTTTAPRWKTVRDRGDIVEIGTPMLPNINGTDGTTTLAAGANGDYNSYWTNFANEWAGRGFAPANGGKIICRLAWEPLGSWFRWCVNANKDSGNPSFDTDPAQGALDFVNYWRHIYDTVKAAQPDLEIWFSPQAEKDFLKTYTGSHILMPQIYPGDNYCDGITFDVYDSDYPRYNNTAYKTGDAAYRLSMQQASWAEQVDPDRWGIQSIADFAVEHNKQLACTEWGVFYRSDGGGGDDNPYFFEQMNAWLREQAGRTVTIGGQTVPLLSHDWLNNDNASADGRHEIYPMTTYPTDFPLAKAEYESLTWGS